MAIRYDIHTIGHYIVLFALVFACVEPILSEKSARIIKPTNFSYESGHMPKVQPVGVNKTLERTRQPTRTKQVTFSSLKNNEQKPQEKVIHNRGSIKYGAAYNNRVKTTTENYKNVPAIPQPESKKYIENTQNNNEEIVAEIEDYNSHQMQGSEEDIIDDDSGKQNGEGKQSKGGGKQHSVGNQSQHGSGGKKGYKGNHANYKGEKGHHRKENHSGKYKDKSGHEKKYEEQGAHQGHFQEGEKGEKGVGFEESGKHSKGHSTKGAHDIHKKEVYEKKIEFFEEDHSDGGEEKHGEFHHKDEHQEGGKSKVGHKSSKQHKSKKGKKGHHVKGNHHHKNQGYNYENGDDEHHGDELEYGHKSGTDSGKKWVYSKGSGGNGKLRHKQDEHLRKKRGKRQQQKLRFIFN